METILPMSSMARPIFNDMSSRSKTYPVILFDFDGTIADTVPLIMESFQYAFSSLTGSKADEQYLLSTIGEPLERTFRILDGSLQSEALNLYFAYNEDHLASGVGVFLGITKMLQKIKSSGSYTAIVTSKRLGVTRFSLDQFELTDYFDVFISRESTLKHKPFPDPIDKAISSIEDKFALSAPINKSDVLFVGDSIHDLLCAKNAGVDVAMVDWTYMDKKLLNENKPEHWIYTPDEIVNLCRPS